MPRVSRTRVIEAPPQQVWGLIADPHNLPRWWPKTTRVEDVRGQGARSRWTTVLETEGGRGVRADYRCTASTEGRRLVWAQDIANTPFERILNSSGLEIQLEPSGRGGTNIELTSDESLRGLSRLGGAMLRGAARRRLDEALDGIEYALVGEPA